MSDKLKLDCMCGGSHSIEIHKTDDQDWPYVIEIMANHTSFWNKIKYLFKTDYLIDDIICDEEQIIKLKEFLNNGNHR